MKGKKREYNLYSFYDRTGIQKHLEVMAEQGWMLEKIGQLFWHYRRIEPKRIRFAVSYFPSASTFDPKPSEKQETFREFCEHAGWKLAADSAQLEIYWNEDENAIPLVTDALVELETIHKSAMKTIVLSCFILLGIWNCFWSESIVEEMFCFYKDKSKCYTAYLCVCFYICNTAYDSSCF